MIIIFITFIINIYLLSYSMYDIKKLNDKKNNI